MTPARPMSKAERAAVADAIRHMLNDGQDFHDVRRGTGVALRRMPRPVRLPWGEAKRLPKGVRS